MRKILFLVSMLLSLGIFAQLTDLGNPKSWDKNLDNLNSIKMPSFDLKVLQDEDLANEFSKDRPFRFGKKFDTNYSFSNSGRWTDLENGDRIWQIRFKSKDAITMNFIFSNFYLPKGAAIYLYNNDRSDLLGAYTERQNNVDKMLGTWLVDGDDVWIEYYEPKKVQGLGSFTISNVTHGYRSISQYNREKGLGESGNCNQDVDCPIGEDLNELKNHNKKGVALILSNGVDWCSGSLINNTLQDRTPYLLTANHCYSNPSTYSFRFNWISPDPVCATTQNSTNGPTNQVISGSELVARRAQSDFLLLELNEDIPTSWDAVWNGWDRSDIAPAKTFGIHHPSGDIMKVCVDNDAPEAIEPNGEEVWHISDWDLGVTEGGSSGSPLFDPNGRIIGQLWRGWAACSGTNDNGEYDEYGRFGISWDAGASPSARLKDWLDPNNSGVTTLDPYPSMILLDVNAGISIGNVSGELCAPEVSPTLVVSNKGAENLTSAKITHQLNNGTPVEIQWTGNLATNESETISLGQIIVAEDDVLTATLENPNNEVDQNPADNTASKVFSFVEAEMHLTNQVIFELIPDNYGSETTWEFKNSSGEVLYSGGPYQDGNNNAVNLTFNLSAEDCYTFVINDEFGDGICCDYGNGSYKLTTANGDIIAQGGEFEGMEATTFKNFDPLSVNDSFVSLGLSIYPNPSNGIFNIMNSGSDQLSYKIFDVSGKLIQTGNTKSGASSINLSKQVKGVYFISFTNQKSNKTLTKKLLLK